MRNQASLYFIVIGVFLLLISGSFLSEGLSNVGMNNAVVSQRMAEGFEGFWLPSLTTPGNIDRMNYLPLGYWIESQWYRVFGSNSFMAEKVYSVLTYFIIAALMIWIWYLIGMPRRTGWVPLMCWITIPIVSWSATNNLLESTMTIFVMLSVVFLIKSEKATAVIRMRVAVSKAATTYMISQVVWVALAAIAMELAFMVKGFSGLFPIVLPLFFWLIVNREGAFYPWISMGFILLVWIVTMFVVVFISPDVYHHLYNYLHHQMIGGLLHVQTVASRFYIIYVLVVQAALPLAILAIISLLRIKSRPFYRFMLFWRHSEKLTAVEVEHSRMGWMMLALGLSGILPIMLGLKQQEFYIVPTLPFFALAMGCLIYDLIEDWLLNISKLANGVLVAIAVLVFGSGLILNISSIHKVNCNEELLSDMNVILPYLSEGEIVSASDEIIQYPEVAEYFYRYKQITFDSMPGRQHFISMYVDASKEITGENYYTDMELPTQIYRIYELKNL